MSRGGLWEVLHDIGGAAERGEWVWVRGRQGTAGPMVQRVAVV